jgi:hypothetical protein
MEQTNAAKKKELKETLMHRALAILLMLQNSMELANLNFLSLRILSVSRSLFMPIAVAVALQK